MKAWAKFNRKKLFGEKNSSVVETNQQRKLDLTFLFLKLTLNSSKTKSGWRELKLLLLRFLVIWVKESLPNFIIDQKSVGQKVILVSGHCADKGDPNVELLVS